MRVLLDSHTLIWAADDPSKLSAAARDWIQDPVHERFISAATAWEIAIKCGLGRLPLSLPYRTWMHKAMTDLALSMLPISLEHADHQTALLWHHRDPFDRLLAAQALVEDMPLVSADLIFDQYGVSRIW